MYITKNKHILSKTIMAVAVFNLCATIMNAFVRFFLGKSTSLAPDMLENAVWNAQRLIFVMQIVATCIVFVRAFGEIRNFRKKFSEDEEREIMNLQLEYNPKGVSVLSMKSIEQLIKIWAAILIGVEIIYEVTSVAYRNMIAGLLNMITASDEQVYLAFISIYNSSHGFKYSGMLIAICIGILTTGVFLHDKTLVFSSIALAALFMIAFLLMENSTLEVASRSFGVVWTSVIFHLLQTVGLFVMALYMNRRYRGM